MVTYIDEVIKRFGGRLGGSSAEKGAQEYTAGILEAYCDKVKVESFKSPLTAHFESLKLFSILYWVSLWIVSTNYGQKLPLAIALSGIGAFFFVMHFLTYRHWLDFLFPKQESWNVEGRIEPTGEARSTLLIAGHIDSVNEFQWWYHFKGFGVALNTIAGFGYVLLPVYLVILWISSYFTPPEGAIMWPYYIFVIISPAALSMFFKHGEVVVDGALDNLSAVALAVEMAKVFSGNNKLKNTRLKIISFGSEEPALRGSFAYAKAHKEELLREKAVLINFDTIKEKSQLTVVPAEINTFVKYPPHLVEKMEKAFLQTNTPYKKRPLPIGATDGSAFAIQGLPAVTVIGMDSGKYDPCYHTRLDNLEHLDPAGLEAMKEVLIRFIRNWDEEQSQ